MEESNTTFMNERSISFFALSSNTNNNNITLSDLLNDDLPCCENLPDLSDNMSLFSNIQTTTTSSSISDNDINDNNKNNNNNNNEKNEKDDSLLLFPEYDTELPINLFVDYNGSDDQMQKIKKLKNFKRSPPKKRMNIQSSILHEIGATQENPLILTLPLNLVWVHTHRKPKEPNFDIDESLFEPLSPSSPLSNLSTLSNHNNNKKKRKPRANSKTKNKSKRQKKDNDIKTEQKEEETLPNKKTYKAKHTRLQQTSEFKANLIYVDNEYIRAGRGQRTNSGIDIHGFEVQPGLFIEFTSVPEERSDELMPPALFPSFSTATQAVTRDLRFGLAQAFLVYRTNEITGQQECLGHLSALLHDSRVRIVNSLSLSDRNSLVDRILNYAAPRMIQIVNQQIKKQIQLKTDCVVAAQTQQQQQQQQNQNDVSSVPQTSTQPPPSPTLFSEFECCLWSSKRMSFVKYLFKNGMYSNVRMLQYE